MSEPIGGVAVPAGTTPEEWAAIIEAYVSSPAVWASLCHGLEGLTRPGVTFTEEQKALIRTIPQSDDWPMGR